MKAAAIRPIPGSASAGGTTIPIEGPLRTPLSSELSDRVHWLLRRGERCIVLDLSRLLDIDAAGAGELVRLRNAVRAASGTLEIAHAPRHVALFLERTGILPLLTPAVQASAECVTD